MKVDKEMVQRAIDGDRGALSRAFVWLDTDQGGQYWSDQYNGRKPIDVDALRAMLKPAQIIEEGKTYTSKNGVEWECVFVRDGKAWMMNDGGTAYVWNADTGVNISQGGGYYNIAFQDTRHGTVEYVNGEPDFKTWKEDE